MQDLLKFVGQFPQGVAPSEIERHFKISRTTLHRRLKEEVARGALLVIGKGPATRYQSADSLANISAYFERPHTERTVASYREALLEIEPGLHEGTLEQFRELPKHTMDKRGLGKFLIDFSCASSVLEGGTYSMLDTQALIEYGEQASGKPIEDAFLVLNHKEAFEFLYDHARLDSIFKVHDLLTNDHGIFSARNSAASPANMPTWISRSAPICRPSGQARATSAKCSSAS
jgi:Fic family protein